MNNIDTPQKLPPTKKDFKTRVKENKPTRWVRFGIVSIIFFAWVAWVGNWWLALAFILLFDIYITGYIPFTWWKESKSSAVRSVMSWVDAIVYALVLVYFIFAFVGQNYMIPTSSLEKTLLTGDYLWVNKVTYGPRVPITPIHFPLVHNKLPILGCNSYLNWPTNSYHRLKGLRNVEEFDIVVFNFPAGDTVATKTEDPNSPFFGQYYDQLVKAYGWQRVNTDKSTFGDVIFRPVDRRENYVKRAVGLPGENFRISNDTIYIDGKAQRFPKNVQFNYLLALSAPLSDDLAKDLRITSTDIQYVQNPEMQRQIKQQLGLDANAFIYFVPLTQGMIDSLKQMGLVKAYAKLNDIMMSDATMGHMYPAGVGATWTISNWGGEKGVVIPKRGLTVDLTPENWQLYKRCIRNYENHPDAEMRNGKVYIDGKEAPTYTFGLDYYFMMGDNRDNSLDSRFWGFVPEDHIVGTPVFVIGSIDQDRGGIRTDRFFIDANPDK